MYTIVNDEPLWIDWKMPHIIARVHVGLRGRVHFRTLVRPITRAHPQVNIRVGRRIQWFQRRKFKKSEYIVNLCEFLP